MTDVQLLLVTFLSLCLLQCVRIVPASARIFQRTVFGNWTVSRPLLRFRSGRKALIWANPLSFPGDLFASQTAIFSLSPDGLLPYPADDPTQILSSEPQTISLGNLSRVRAAGNDLVCDSNYLGTFLLSLHAHDIASRLRELSETKHPKTAEEIIHAGFDSDELQQCLTSFSRSVRFMQIGSILFFLAAIALFLSWDRFGIRSAVWTLLPLTLGWIAALVAQWFNYRRLYPEMRATRWFTLAEGIIYPISLVRAADSLSLSLLENYHHSAVAIALEANNITADTLAQSLREVRSPILPPPTTDTRADTIRRFMLECTERELLQLARRNKITLNEAGFPHRRNETLPRYYCPRCLTGYDEQRSECSDCPGVPLRRSDS